MTEKYYYCYYYKISTVYSFFPLQILLLIIIIDQY